MSLMMGVCIVGTVECNPDSSEAIELTITFKDYNLTGPIYYPQFKKVKKTTLKF